MQFVSMLFFARYSDFAIHRESLSGTFNARLVSTGSTGEIWTHLRDEGEATCRRRHQTVLGTTKRRAVLGASPGEACVTVEKTANGQYWPLEKNTYVVTNAPHGPLHVTQQQKATLLKQPYFANDRVCHNISHAIQRYVVSDVVTRTVTTLSNDTVTMCSEDQNNDTTLILTTSVTSVVFFSRAPVVHAMNNCGHVLHFVNAMNFSMLRC